nr:hypothetical protein [Tanacetum cinerariifolium]
MISCGMATVCSGITDTRMVRRADDERTESDDDEEETQDEVTEEEYERINEELYGDVNVSLTYTEPTDKEKDDEEMTVTGHVNVNQEGEEVEAEEDAPPAATLPVGSPITPPPLSESSSDTEAAIPIVSNGAFEMPPTGSLYEVGGPSSVSSFPPFYLHGREIARLDDNNELLLSNAWVSERFRRGAMDARPDVGVDGSATFGDSQPPKPPGSPSSSQ